MRFSFVKSSTPITQGLASTLQYCGHNTILWDKQFKPTFDMFDEYKPDIVLAYVKDIDNCLLDAINTFDVPCVILEAEGIFEPFIAFNPSPASNPVQYGKSIPVLRYKTDILYFSYVESLKGIPFLDVLTRYKFKMFGPKKIPYPQYLGYLSNTKEYSRAIKSAQILIDVNGYDLLNAAMLNVNSIAYGLNPVTYPDYFLSFNSIEELTELIDKKMKSPKFDKRQKDFALDNTFFHRASELMDLLNKPEEAKGITNKWNVIRSEF